MRIALAQIKSGTDPTANLATVTEYVARAAADGARLVVFPEGTMCRFGVPLREIAEPTDGPWADGVRRAAADHGVTVVAGMFCPADGARHQHPDRHGPRRGHPLRQDPPVRRVRLRRVGDRSARA